MKALLVKKKKKKKKKHLWKKEKGSRDREPAPSGGDYRNRKSIHSLQQRLSTETKVSAPAVFLLNFNLTNR